jgi:hypothetical protein
MGRRLPALGVVLAVAAGAATVAAAAAVSAPDAHDRAAIRTLVAQVTRFERAFPKDLNLDRRFDSCLAIKVLKASPGGDAKAAEVAVKLLDRALLDEMQMYRTPVERITSGVARIHPHDVIFNRWLRQVGSALDVLVRLSRTPTPHIAFCAGAAKVVRLQRAGNASQAAVDRALDIDASQRTLIQRLLRMPSDPPAEKAFIAWLRGAGYSSKTIELLTG